MVSNNGQVFFETTEALLPRDTNGQTDVYEFDSRGGLHLISTGTSSGESLLLDASVSGDDVFFLTPQSLVPQDTTEEALRIYDARVDGGFPEGALPPACTTADACRAAAAPQPSIYGAPSSQTFSGTGTSRRRLKRKLRSASKDRQVQEGLCEEERQMRQSQERPRSSQPNKRDE